jgi:5-methylcytosine-specific restriction endonuclease McrA
VDEYQIRSSTSYARQKVHERDGGVCASCGRDTDAFRQLRARVRGEWFGYHENPHIRAFWRNLKDALERRLVQAGVVRSSWADHVWEMDHIAPVDTGGGACGLENLQTLCVPCHRRKTALQARAKADARKGQGRLFEECS